MAQPVAKLENVSRLYGRFAALRRVTASFEAGRCYLLLGENGAGKSTLLRILAGLLKPTSGRVLLNLAGADSAGDSSADPSGVRGQFPSAERYRIGFMSHQSMLYDELSAIENLHYFHRLYRGVERLSPEEALRSVGLDPALARPISQYSQGMRQRAALARVLISRPRLVLLDEPFSNVDAATIQRMLEIVARQRDDGRTVLLTTHQREVAIAIADHVLTLSAGRLAGVEDLRPERRAGVSSVAMRPEPVPL